MNPVLTGLIATAVGLLVVVCAVVVALYRRHQHRRHPRQAKLSQLEAALHQADDPVSADGGCAGAGHTTPLNPTASSTGGVIVAADHRTTEDTDPDIIPNKYGMLTRKTNRHTRWLVEVLARRSCAHSEDSTSISRVQRNRLLT